VISEIFEYGILHENSKKSRKNFDHDKNKSSSKFRVIMPFLARLHSFAIQVSKINRKRREEPFMSQIFEIVENK
jgi:hypothetical protein